MAARDYHNGQTVRVAGTVGDAESGNLKGERGQVYGVNPCFTNSAGVPMVNVRLDSGAVYAIPQKALKDSK